MNDHDKDILRQDRFELVNALKVAGATFKGDGKTCTCPFHDDKNASAGIYPDGDAWKFKCHGCKFGGDVIDVIAKKEGKQPADVLKEMTQERQPAPAKPKRVFADLDALKKSFSGVEAVYAYTHPTTQVVEMAVIRIRNTDGKRFFQARPVNGGFVLEAPPKPWPLYNRTRVLAAQSVIVVEGEKAVHALTASGAIATTSPGGAGKAAHADWTPLPGKLVYLWPDNDPIDESGKSTGISHMEDVARHVETLDPPCQIRWIDPAMLGLPDKGDAVEYLELFGGDTPQDKRGALACALETAQPIGPAADLRQLLEDTIAGKRRAIPWPWRGLGHLTKALMPGTVTCICGEGGSTKSLLISEAGIYWHTNGVKLAIYALEEDRPYHLNRVLAQLDENSNLTDTDWVRAHPQETRAAFAQHQSFIDAFARCIHTAPDDQVTLDELVAWVRRQAQAGVRICVVDPITAAAASDKPWIDDLRFLMAVKVIVRKYGVSLVLVTHPRKGRKQGMSLDDLAGGAAYPRFAQTVAWIQRHDQPKRVCVRTDGGDMDVEINRSIRLVKTRNGRGAGLELGFVFDGSSLRFSEQGIVLKKKPKPESTLKDEIERHQEEGSV